MRALIVLVALGVSCWASAGTAEVFVLEEATGEAIANALAEAKHTADKLELVTAKLAAADARAVDLLAQLDALRQVVESQAAQLTDLRAALDRSAERDERIAQLLDETTRTLERSRKELDRVGIRPWWEKALDWASRLLPLALFLAL